MKKIDLKKEYKQLYTAKAEKPEIIKVPPLNYLMIDGEGDPNKTHTFQEAIGTLYSISYTLKFSFKKGKGIDYTVMLLEGLWWVDEGEFQIDKKDNWKWTLMIMQPDFIKREQVLKTMDVVKKKSKFSGFPEVRLEKLDEGTSAQIMHIGPYSAEGPTIELLHKFIREEGYKPCLRHHEIYMGDPHRTAPEKLKTIIRQPIAKP